MRCPTTLRSALLAGALVVVALLALPGTAAAHAILEGGSVADGQVLDTAPEELSLDFDEGVSAPRAGLRVYDAVGERVDVGGTFQSDDADDLVRVALQDDLPDGSYVLTYRVTSADGHPVDGALVFSVGSEVGASDELVAAVFSADADRPWAVAAAVARGVVYVGALLAAGAALVLAWLRREVVAAATQADEGAAGPAPAEGEEATRVAAWVRRGAWAAVAGSIAGVVLQVVLVTGDGLASLVDGGALAEVAASVVGLSAGVRLVGLAGLIALARRGPAALSGMSGAVAAAVALGSLLLEGHTLTTEPAALVWTAAAVHIAAGALWVGGLAVLAVVLRVRRRADDPVGAGRVVARTSTLLTIAVVGVLLAGSALSWAEVRALRALTGTSYGVVLLAKLGAVVPLLALGVWNNRRLVPVLTARRRRRAAPPGRPVVAGGSDEPRDRGGERDGAWAALGRTVRVELAIIGVVLALTGVLVALQPAAEAAGITGAYSETVPFPGIGQMTFTVDPNRAGQNEIHLYLLGETGRPVDVAESIEVRLTQTDLDIGPIVREPILAGPGHYVLSGPELGVAGPWRITTEVALNRFDVVEASIDVTVNP
jgi:copper transport protein